MGPLMYRHRPAYPALIGAAVSLIGGAVVTLVLRDRAAEGLMSINAAVMAGAITVVIAGAFIISAFARYSFTHLWKSTGARHSDKYKEVEDRKRREKARARARS